MAGPQDRDRGPSRDEKFDAVWGELLGDGPGEAPSPAKRDSEPSGEPDRTKTWDDSARAPAERAAPPAADPGGAQGIPAQTRTAHAGTLAKEAQEAAAAREMQRLMEDAAAEARAAAPALRLVTREENGDAAQRADGDANEGGRESADDGATGIADADADASRSADGRADADADESGSADADPGTSGSADGHADVDAGADEAPGRTADVVAPERSKGDAEAKVEPPVIVAQPRARPVAAASTVARDPTPAAAAAGGGNKMLIGLVAIAIAVGVGWMIVRDPAPARTAPALAKPPPAAPIEPDPLARASAQPPPRPPSPIPAAHADEARDAPLDEDGSTGDPAAEAAEPQDPARPEDAPAGGDRNLREPPPGTPEDIAAAFRKLPVSAADRPPVGGIGAGGIHVDRIWMGSTYENGDCIGKTDTFSVSADPRPSVCIRVVHPREKEEIVVVWEKTGGSARRSKVTIKPLHAYRTRAYLMLRREYVGDWTVRVLSQDGVELASHVFHVVE